MADAPHAVIVMGVSGSGKTTVAEQLATRLGWGFADGDAFHPAANVEKMRGGQPLTDHDRWPWLHAIAAEIDRRRATHEHIVIACSALKHPYRQILIGGKPDVRLVYLKGTRALIMSRLHLRKDHYMPASLLDSQFEALEEPGADEHALVIGIDTSIDAIVDEIVRGLR